MKNNDECVFCKIASGEIPACKAYEDESVVVILDIRPINEGHVLVIPKVHVDEFQNLDNTTYTHTMKVAKRLAQTIKSTLHPARVGLVIEGFEVPHTHVKVIPLKKIADISSAQPKEASDISELEKVAVKLRANLKK